MILPDVNLLLYAQDQLSAQHDKARRWWDGILSGLDPVCLCWPVLTGFLRIVTNPRAIKHGPTLEAAIDQVQLWLDQPCVRLIHPTPAHWKIFSRVLKDGQAAANLVSDAHLAALAIEHGCELNSTDADFGRFQGLRWRNPLK